MARRPRPAPSGAPEWCLTYGDMMSLLLCFFILLAAFSEIKKDDELHRALDAIKSAFGYDAMVGEMPVPLNSKDSVLMQLQEIMLREHTQELGDSEVEGLEGIKLRVTQVRDGIQIIVGGPISFDQFSAILKPEGRSLLDSISRTITGLNTVLYVRGHTTSEPLPKDSPYADSTSLAFARARAVEAVLLDAGVEARRIRLHAVGDREPLLKQAYDERRRAPNRRVEIVLTESLVDDYEGETVVHAQGVADGK